MIQNFINVIKYLNFLEKVRQNRLEELYFLKSNVNDIPNKQNKSANHSNMHNNNIFLLPSLKIKRINRQTTNTTSTPQIDRL